MTKSLHGHYKSQGNEHLKRWVAMSPPEGLSTECCYVVVYVMQGTNEVLRLFISLTCLQYAGLQIIESVK